MNIVAKTDIGLHRTINQDSLMCNKNSCAVADGMGGHRAGEIASKTAIELIEDFGEKFKANARNIKQLFNDINKEIFEAQLMDPKLKGMGTTLTALWFTKNEFWVGHVGDSRCYIINNNRIRQITRDHSYVGELLIKGLINSEEARIHPYRNVIDRAMGINYNVEVDIIHEKLNKDDTFLLCSDGLNSMVADDKILEIISNNNINSAAELLIAEALIHGGKDNISLVLAKAEGIL